jgi:hypothetical protein
VLLNAFLEATQFIHFTTFGISHIFIGALKLTAQRVKAGPRALPFGCPLWSP